MRCASRKGQSGPVTKHSRDTPQFFLTSPSACPYLPGKKERKVFTHLVGERAPEINDILTHGGFRRSQSIAYRPACESCRACVSVRVVVNDFKATKTFRRIQWNFVWAMGYNVVMIPIAAGVLYPQFHVQMPPWVAGGCMVFSSVSVVLSSLTLRAYKPPMRVQKRDSRCE